MIQKILDYENKLLEYRAELNELIKEQSKTNCNQNMMQAKIAYLKKELAYMDHQLNMLKAGLDTSAIPAQKQQAAPGAKSANTVYTYDNKYIDAVQRKPDIPADSTIPAKRNSKDLENLMGKNLMGIFASVLIFISFIVFATVILPNLSNEIKMLAMYLVSFAFLGLGLYLQKKDNANKIYLSISGCGIGAIYVSLLISNVYFNVIGDITMYVLIFIWALFVCYLSCTKSWIFQIIGQIGITISILFGAILCTETDDWTKLLFLIVFFIASQIIFLVVHYEDEYWDNIVNIIGALACLFILYNAVPLYYIAYEHIITITLCRMLLILFALAQITLGFFKFKISAKSRILLAITNIGYFLLFSQLFVFDGKPLYLIGFALLSLIAIEYKFAQIKSGEFKIMKSFYALTLIFRMYQLNSLDSLEFIMDYASFSLLVIPFAIYGFLAKDKLYKVFSMVYMTLFVFDFGMYDTPKLILGIGLICLFCYLLKEKQYSTGIKTYLYVATLFFMLISSIPIVETINLSDETEAISVLAAICITHTLAIISPFGKNWNDGSREHSFTAVSGIANAILMLISLVYIENMSDSLLHFMTILIALMLFSINSKNLLQRESIFWGIYVGIKFTIFMIVILNSFTAPDFAISICCLLFAIASIVIGFLMKYKSLRVYGLGLSLLSIVKLIMIDMSYESTLSRAFSFFVCGILCFVISSIYNYVDRKISK